MTRTPPSAPSRHHGESVINDNRVSLKSLQVDNSGEESGRDESEDDAEDDGGDDEARVVDVVLGQDAHAQEEEDDAVAGGGQRLHRVLHRCETLLADVLERVVLRSHSKTYDADNS